MRLYFISGASGSGKTAIMPELQKILGSEIKAHDFDDIGVPDGADKIYESLMKPATRLQTCGTVS